MIFKQKIKNIIKFYPTPKQEKTNVLVAKI